LIFTQVVSSYVSDEQVIKILGTTEGHFHDVNKGNPVKVGKYTVCIEAAREHGGYNMIRREMDFTGKPQEISMPAESESELGAITLDYKKQ